MSGKADWYRKLNLATNILTVLVAAFVTFIGFVGVDELHQLFFDSKEPFWTQSQFEFFFNSISFCLLVLVFVQQYLRYGDRQYQAERAIVALSSFINLVRDRASQGVSGNDLTEHDLEIIRERYEAIISSIPPNTDEEYKVAVDAERPISKHAPYMSLQALGNYHDEQRIFLQMLAEREDLFKILSSVRRMREDAWVAGGLFRSMIWDNLHAYPVSTPIDDVDVIYFDRNNIYKAADERLESDFKSQYPSVSWSVKNQARMHLHNGDAEYLSIEDAVSKFPEVCTAFAVRLDSYGEIEVVAPYGLTDTLSLIVRPTAKFISDPARVVERVDQKQWLKKWPKLRLIC
jgi:hypothetical protein